MTITRITRIAKDTRYVDIQRRDGFTIIFVKDGAVVSYNDGMQSVTQVCEWVANFLILTQAQQKELDKELRKP